MNALAFAVCESAVAGVFAAGAMTAARRCGVTLDLMRRVPAAVLTCGLAAGAAAFALGAFRGDAPAFGVIVAAAAVCAASDVATGLVFDAVTLPALAALLLCAACTGHAAASIAGALCAAGVLMFIYAVTHGRGIGLGDVKLAACIGAALGLRASLYAIGFAFVAGAAAGVAALALRRIERGAEIRFAPYLAAGTIAAALWQPI